MSQTNEKIVAEYVTAGTERSGDVLCLTEFEAHYIGHLAVIGSGQATAFMRFNKDQPRYTTYRITIERILP